MLGCWGGGVVGWWGGGVVGWWGGGVVGWSFLCVLVDVLVAAPAAVVVVLLLLLSFLLLLFLLPTSSFDVQRRPWPMDLHRSQRRVPNQQHIPILGASEQQLWL